MAAEVVRVGGAAPVDAIKEPTAVISSCIVACRRRVVEVRWRTISIGWRVVTIMCSTRPQNG